MERGTDAQTDGRTETWGPYRPTRSAPKDTNGPAVVAGNYCVTDEQEAVCSKILNFDVHYTCVQTLFQRVTKDK